MTIQNNHTGDYDDSIESHTVARQNSDAPESFFHEAKDKVKEFLGRNKSEEEAKKAHDEVYKEKKAHVSHELIGAAAGYEAVKSYQKRREEKGLEPKHSKMKQIVAGMAMAEAVRLFETRGNGDAKAKREAASAAAAQAESMVHE